MAPLIDNLLIGIGFSVDEKTARACLVIAEIYANQTGAEIIGHKEYDGSLAYHFEYRSEPRGVKEDAAD